MKSSVFNRFRNYFEHNKSVRVMTLLFTALLIGTASATAFYNLTLRTTPTVNTPGVQFTSGNDSTSAGATFGTNNTYVRLGSIKAYPNSTATYEQAVNFTNTAGSSQSVRLRSISITGNSNNFTSVIVKIVDNTGTTQRTLTYTGGVSWTNDGPTTFVSVANNAEWSIRVETNAVAGADNNVSCTILLALDVQL